MIQFFRVYELQRLLLQLNLNHYGRKDKLQQRLVDALAQNFNTIAPQIREIYKSCGPDSQPLPPPVISQQTLPDLGPPPEKRMYQPPQLQHPMQPAAQLVGGNIVVPFHGNMAPNNYPIHPDVRLKKLAFYDILATLIQPSTLLPQNSQRLQEATFYFTLTPQQATEIASNRDIRNGSKIEHTIQVQLRFCLLETSCEQEDCFPPNIIVKVNNKMCQLPNPIPTNRPNVEPKRPPRPVNVTSNVKLSPTVTNNVTVQWCPDFSRGYVFSAYLVRKLTSAQLLHRMKTKGIKPADFTRALIKEKLTEDADCEIATTMLKVSLICPLGKMKMSIPCRASTCSHLQCFDASLFLQMNERKPTWNCPVCDKPALYESLVIDGYFQEVLASALLGSDDTEIQLHKDGSWSTHVMKNEAQILDTSSKSVQKVEVISDDLELITTEPEVKPKSIAPVTIPIATVTPTVTSNSNNNSNTNEPTSTTNNDTVDLTLSDSDDDLPLKRIAAPSANNGKTNSTSNGTVNQAKTAPQKSKNDETTIISLDSPSPPSSPVNVPSDNSGSNSGSSITSTTIPFCPLPENPLESTDGNSANLQINPLALNRQNSSVDPLATPPNPAFNRYFMNANHNSNTSSSNPTHSNYNIVRPYREDDDKEK
ncbi:E3 SUMO-protein ligase PIAS3 isoform X3 [Condylostylus longicornis]|nr:E3 SUMO-protein ligase PIAS3 isoform X3 [Condylostylus longicornis]